MNPESNRDSFIDYLREIPNFLSVFLVPLLFLTVSPMLIEMSRTTGISAGDLSLVMTFFTIGLIAGQLTSVIYNRRFSKLQVIITGYILVILFLVSLSFTNTKVLFYALYLILGYIAGVIWIQCTTSILENRIKNKDRLTTIFLSFYPIGSMAAPFVSSALINNGISWRYSYYLVAALAVVVIILFLMLKRGRKGIHAREEERIPIKKIFYNRNRNIVFMLGCLILFFYCISESVVVVWVPTFLRTSRSFDIQNAGLSISIFWFAILIGRMIVSLIAGRFKTNFILLLLSAVAIISLALFIPQYSVFTALLAIAFAGLGHSGIITLGVSSASTVYEKGRGILASIVFGAINAGASLAPFITRSLSGISMALSVMAAPFFMGFTLIFIIVKIIYERKTIKMAVSTPEA